MNIDLVLHHTSIIDEITCGEIVGAIQDIIIAFKQSQDIFRIKSLVKNCDVDIRVECCNGFFGRLGFEHANAFCIMNDLPLQIAEVDRIEVDDSHIADTGGGKIKCGGRAQPTCAYQKNF